MSSRTRRRRPSQSLAGPVVVGLVIGSLVVTGGGVGVWFLLRSPQVTATHHTTATESKPTEAAIPTGPKLVEPKVVANTPNEPPATPPKKQPDRRLGTPLPAPPAADAKVVERAKEVVPLGFPAAAIKDVRFSPCVGDVPAVFVLRKEFGGFQGVGATDVIERVTRKGRPDGRFEIPADKVQVRRPFDVTDTAQRVLIEAPSGKLTVYDFESKAKVWDGVDVFADQKERVGPPVAAFFVNPDQIAVVDRRGAVDTWDVNAKQRKATGVAPGNAGGLVAATRAADRTIVVIGRQVFAFHFASTADAPVAELPSATAEPIAVSADPLGKQIAVVYRVPNQVPKHSIAVLRLGEKTPVMQAPLPDTFGTPTGIGWVGIDTLGVSTDDRATVLVDVERAVPFVYAKDAAATPFVNEFGLFTYTTADPADTTKAVLVGIEMPFARHRELIVDSVSTKSPVYLAPRATGLAR